MLSNLSLFLGAFTDAFIGPNLLVPGEPFMIAAGYQLYAGSLLGVGLVLAGGFLGDQASFAVGRRYGRNIQKAILKKRPSLRRRVAQGKLMLKRNEKKVLITARLLGPVAWVIPFIAGANGTNWKRFSLYSSIGLILGVGQFVFWGYLLAMGIENFPFINGMNVFISEHSSLLILIASVAGFYLLARRYCMRYKGLAASMLLIAGLGGLNYSLFFEQLDDFAGKNEVPLIKDVSEIEFKAYAGESSYFNAQAINVIYVGDSPEAMMLEMGWIKNRTFSYDDISITDYVGLLRTKTPPVSDLYWNGQPQHLAFQEPGTLSKRNHIRWWPVKLPVQSEQETLWLGAISYDDGLGISAYSGLITLLHTIDADVDQQRDKLASSIDDSIRWQGRFRQMTGPVAVDENHDYFTDGRVLVIEPALALGRVDLTAEI
ncbi:LssY C-terminal domain-containing protein [Vibrio sp. JC009]|uniref:LssY C-terminal domain-containing protein n=1 Tax=Vibrio sp. JC009 TaxID=2912314 RepID=UPI0023B2006E|nr:LssY C-terminal domain-containing protein [Vibrio sp. JC009]WED23621.1 LssY C-terminal domain-containing protein [Vibrio sp. JC009]